MKCQLCILIISITFSSFFSFSFAQIAKIEFIDPKTLNDEHNREILDFLNNGNIGISDYASPYFVWNYKTRKILYPNIQRETVSPSLNDKLHAIYENSKKQNKQNGLLFFIYEDIPLIHLWLAKNGNGKYKTELNELRKRKPDFLVFDYSAKEDQVYVTPFHKSGSDTKRKFKNGDKIFFDRLTELKISPPWHITIRLYSVVNETPLSQQPEPLSEIGCGSVSGTNFISQIEANHLDQFIFFPAFDEKMAIINENDNYVYLKNSIGNFTYFYSSLLSDLLWKSTCLEINNEAEKRHVALLYIATNSFAKGDSSEYKFKLDSSLVYLDKFYKYCINKKEVTSISQNHKLNIEIIGFADKVPYSANSKERNKKLALARAKEIQRRIQNTSEPLKTTIHPRIFSAINNATVLPCDEKYFTKDARNVLIKFWLSNN